MNNNFDYSDLAVVNGVISFSYINLDDPSSNWVEAEIPENKFCEWAQGKGYFNYQWNLISPTDEPVQNDGIYASFDEFVNVEDKRFVYSKLIEYHQSLDVKIQSCIEAADLIFKNNPQISCIDFQLPGLDPKDVTAFDAKAIKYDDDKLLGILQKHIDHRKVSIFLISVPVKIKTTYQKI